MTLVCYGNRITVPLQNYNSGNSDQTLNIKKEVIGSVKYKRKYIWFQGMV